MSGDQCIFDGLVGSVSACRPLPACLAGEAVWEARREATLSIPLPTTPASSSGRWRSLGSLRGSRLSPTSPSSRSRPRGVVPGSAPFQLPKLLHLPDKLAGVEGIRW